MPSLKDIRRRISSVKNTQQITKAMKLVSAAKLRRAQQAIASARPFAEKMEKISSRVLGEIEGSLAALAEEKRTEAMQKLHPLLETRTIPEGAKKKLLVVVVSSDRGLCGAYNTNVIRFASRKLREWSQDPALDLSIIYTGKKGSDLLSKRGFLGDWRSDFWSGKFTTKKSDKISEELIKKFLTGEADEVVFIYTRFKTVISQTVEAKTILPLSHASDQAARQSDATIVAQMSNVAGNGAVGFLYEPSREAILSDLLAALIKTQVYRMFADGLASEFGARMTAMENATRNAGEMISKLTLQANRVRQASITKELMEIVSGAEALKG